MKTRFSLRLIAFSVLLTAVACAQSSFPGKTAQLESIENFHVTAPAFGKVSSELLEFRNKAIAIVGDDSATDEERQTAADLRDRTTRQIEIAAKLPRPQARIVGGRTADYSKFQYQVALVFSGYPSARDGQFCGGTLIRQSWIVTAAHCLNADTRPGDIRIYTGSAKLSTGGQFVPVLSIIRHEFYNPQTNDNDIALIQTSIAVSKQPIGIVPSTDAEAALFKVSRNAIISGWGDTHEGAKAGSDDLLYANAPVIIPPDSCINSYSAIGYTVSANMICAGGGSPPVDACQGDSGGPLVLHATDGGAELEGVVSWGQGCAQSKYPGVYTRVPVYAGWIQQKIGTGTQ